MSQPIPGKLYEIVEVGTKVPQPMITVWSHMHNRDEYGNPSSKAGASMPLGYLGHGDVVLVVRCCGRMPTKDVRVFAVKSGLVGHINMDWHYHDYKLVEVSA